MNGSADVLDIERVDRILKEDVPLDTERLRQQDIPLYTPLMNVDTKQLEYYDVRKSPFSCLKASVTRPPYCTGVVEIDGKRFVDGMVKEQVGLTKMQKDYPDGNKIFIDNYSSKNDPKGLMGSTLESYLSSRMFGWSYQETKTMIDRKKKHNKEELREAEDSDQILLLQPDPAYEVSYTTTDKTRLKKH